MEIWDLYDANGNNTGETWERIYGAKNNIPEGRYHIIGNILVKHKDGTYLLTLRDPNKDAYPGFWQASAGGSAQHGEGPIECAKRELFEETGIISDSFELVSRSFSERSHSLIYSYLTEVDCDKEGIVLQKDETVDYKWVDAAGLIEYSESDLAIKNDVKRYEDVYEKLRREME